jgi:cobalt-zinc-cadmium efflux system outer membrane protein
MKATITLAISTDFKRKVAEISMSAAPTAMTRSIKNSLITMLTISIMLMATEILQADGETSFPYQTIEKLALEKNPDLKVAFFTWQAAIAKAIAARSLPDPTLSYSEFVEEVQTRVGPQRRKLGLMQMFPWFGTLKLRQDVALGQAEILAQQCEDKSLMVVEKVRLSLYDLILLEKKIVILQSHLRLLKQLEASRKGGLSSGRSHLSNVLKIQVEMETLKDQILSLESMRVPLRQKFDSIMGFTFDGQLPSTWPREMAFPPKNQIEATYKQHHPEWMSQQKAIQVADGQVSLARKKGLPNFGVGLSWVDTGPASLPGTSGSGDDPLALTFSVSLPMWRSKVKSELQSAVHSRMAIESRSESLLLTFRTHLQMIYFELEDSGRKITLYQDQILPKAKDAYDSAKKGHESNVVSFQDVLDAERMLLRFTLNLEESFRDQAVAQAKLIRIVNISPIHVEPLLP